LRKTPFGALCADTRGSSERSSAKLGLEKNGEDRIVMPTNGDFLLMTMPFNRYDIADMSTGRLKLERT
jgi:hypothetical protein